MPLYEYQCKGCGKTVELLRTMEEIDKPARCSECGGRMGRILSVAGGIRMGTGRAPGTTCCGRSERCDSPPCSDGSCYRDSHQG